jgi:flavorubredoxin
LYHSADKPSQSRHLHKEANLSNYIQKSGEEENMAKAIIIYETRKGGTRLLAGAVQEGLEQSGINTVVKRISEVNVAELADYTAVILGSPTYNKNMIETMKTFLFKLEQSNLKGKIGAAFGAYGWSGEAVGMISETMKQIYSMDVFEPPAKLDGKADEFGLGQHRDLGRKIAIKIEEKTK